MIWIFANGPIIPNGVLVVDGSLRTFNCEEVVPVTGTSVGEDVGGMEVRVGGGIVVGGSVAVMMNGVAVPLDGAERFNSHADRKSISGIARKKYLGTRHL